MQRAALVAAAVAVAIAVFLLVRPHTNDKQPVATTGTSTTAKDGGPARPPARPSTYHVKIAHREPVGGIQRLQIQAGAPARIVVSSSDTSGEVHLHGYDIEREIAPGKPARLAFKAKLEGVFTLELHPETEIAKVEVHP